MNDMTEIEENMWELFLKQTLGTPGPRGVLMGRNGPKLIKIHIYGLEGVH